MDVKEMVPYLNQKLKRAVEVVPPKKEEEKKEKEGGGEKGEKKEKDGGGEKGEKKEKGDGGEKKEKEVAAEAKAEVNKMEFMYPMAPPSFWYQGGQFPGQTSYAMEVHPSYGGSNHFVEQGYMNHGYPMQPPLPYYMHPNAPPPQMFSDENPNACSIM